MSGTTTRRAAFANSAGSTWGPPITREAASEYVAGEISLNAWSAIRIALAGYDASLDDLKASRVSRSKDPKKASWHERQKRTVKSLEAVLDRLKATHEDGDFLREASENYALATSRSGTGSEPCADRMLRDAWYIVFNALAIVERAEPLELEVPTEATARANLVRDIRDELVRDGIEARASTGRALDIPDRAPRLSDLTPFEQLLDALGIGEEMTIKSFSEFVRSAISQKTRKGG